MSFLTIWGTGVKGRSNSFIIRDWVTCKREYNVHGALPGKGGLVRTRKSLVFHLAVRAR